ncbi:MAG: hypothetical protein ACK40G_01840 [Cytophagaceae bacterium]
MNTIDTLVIVDADSKCNHLNERKIKESGISNNVKVTLNGGHALLYLNQISHKTVCSKTVVILNMDTPIANGFDFLEGLKYSNEIYKDNVLVVVVNDNLDENKLEKTKKLGVNHFISSGLCTDSLKNLISEYFNSNTSKVNSTASITAQINKNPEGNLNNKRKKVNIITK